MTILQPSQLPCPASPEGDTHHLVPIREGKTDLLRCSYCHQTEKMLRTEANRAHVVLLEESATRQEGEQQSPDQPGGPEQGQPEQPDQDQDEQDGEAPYPLEHPHYESPSGTSQAAPQTEGG